MPWEVPQYCRTSGTASGSTGASVAATVTSASRLLLLAFLSRNRRVAPAGTGTSAEALLYCACGPPATCSSVAPPSGDLVTLPGALLSVSHASVVVRAPDGPRAVGHA